MNETNIQYGFGYALNNRRKIKIEINKWFFCCLPLQTEIEQSVDTKIVQLLSENR